MTTGPSLGSDFHFLRNLLRGFLLLIGAIFQADYKTQQDKKEILV